MLRIANRREQEIAKRIAGIKSSEIGVSAVYADASGNSDHVPLLWTGCSGGEQQAAAFHFGETAVLFLYAFFGGLLIN